MTIESLARTASGVMAQPISPSVREIDRLVHLVADRLEPGLSTPGRTPGAEIRGLLRICLELLIQRAAGHPIAADANRLEAAAAACAHADIPIGTVLHAMHEGFIAGLDLIVARTGPADCLGVLTGTAAVVELSRLSTGAIGKAYVREHRARAAEHQTATHGLTAALLGGRLPAQDGELPVADTYFVLAVAIAAHPDEALPRLDRRVVARRKLRRVQAALACLLEGRALALLSVDGGTILIPGTAITDAGLDDLVHGLREAGQAELTATVVAAGPHEVHTAAHRAHELLDTVQQLGLAPGLHRFSQLALQYQLTRPGLGRDALGTRLTPLDDHPELLETLRVYLETDQSRVRTARRLDIHPNTVDYRLRRIGRLTGFDPAETGGLWNLHSALIARTDQRGAVPGPADSHCA